MQPQDALPYKSFDVTRACEWKSNLFVPKSNDIHFAQPDYTPPDVVRAPRDASAESAVVYAPESSAGASELPAGLEADGARVLASTSSKALVLSLPVASMGHNFGGFEPACAIRLVVPRNMRILAKLSSRRLAFAQEQQPAQVSPQQQVALVESPDQQQQAPSLWLNASANQFAETEQRTVETEGNVLAFRFLLERFAHRRSPDVRFQVVLTAFQTLGENSDFGQSQASAVDASPAPQFICDRQRLISSNLVCDGYRNCEDGHDEEPAQCLDGQRVPLVVRPTPPPVRPLVAPPPDAGRPQTPWTRLLPAWPADWLGALLGLLLVATLLACCCCCLYCGYLLWRRHLRRWWHRLVAADEDERDELSAAKQVAAAEALRRARSSRRKRLMRAHDDLERDALAAQNADNAQRLLRRAHERQAHTPPQPPARLHSILKRPSAQPSPAHQLGPTTSLIPPTSGAPLAAFTPTETPQRRGALASSLTDPRARGSAEFKPTPARRHTRPVPPPPSSGSGLGYPPPPALSTDRSARPPGRPPPTPPPPSLDFGAAGGLLGSGATRSTTTSTTGTQRVTIYHYSAGTTRMSESYLERLASEHSVSSTPGTRDTDDLSPGETATNNPTRSSLI